MSSTEAPISINLKTAGGTQITLRAETPDEFTTLTSSVFQIVEAVNEVEAAVRGQNAPLTQASNLIAQSLGATPVHQDIPPFNPAPIGGGRTCPHGKMTGIQGQSKQGGIYKGYFCPSAQGDPSKCKTIYIDKSNPEWNTFVPERMK